MKFLAFLILGLIGVWFLRTRPVRVKRGATRQQPAQVQEMLRCNQCGVHLPASEAVKGANGNYCCQDHLRQSEH